MNLGGLGFKGLGFRASSACESVREREREGLGFRVCEAARAACSNSGRSGKPVAKGFKGLRV